MSGPTSQNPILPALPAKERKPADMTVEHLYHDKESVQSAKFDVQFADSAKRQGFTDVSGHALLENAPPGVAKIRYTPDDRAYVRVTEAANPHQGKSLDDVIGQYAPAPPSGGPGKPRGEDA